jgi:hypothetical protein
MSATEIPVRALLNAQTGQIGWPELARHFARGVVVCVADGEDLVAVAERFVGDCAEDIERLSAAGRVWRAQDRDARRWQNENTRFWGVVVAPWVLVQEALTQEDSSNED